ncbi:bifunctional homocysteine S-methyltransferase/methylenetetrahydrofolate reductase [Anaerocolumna sp.]|uniref:bifunctional homocysteine S-methyltransferase/methylenetetrahydrofolate reductase n=1 Tax=Anaerocolumna sp. TaxID=2041569 RepID=UPI0028A73DC7|nr:bifunctional homocysteine S-methyltransferase/methylenetetrahydrofolate reductase [Anaerocolumna sp.]
MKIKEYLLKHKLIMDGAMGTYYSRLVNNDNEISEYANLYTSDTIINIHKNYIEAGAKLIRTNSFAANREALSITSAEQEKLIKASYEIAKKAVMESGKEVYIACDIGPISESAKTEEEILEEYEFICDIFIKEKPEVILFETFSSFKYIRELVPYIKEKLPDTFIITNFCLDKNGYTASGISITSLLEELSETDEIDAGGFNCGIGSGHMYHLLKKVSLPDNKYIVITPNAGYPEQFQNRMVFMDNEGYFTENMKRIAGLGVDIMGGCCGTTPNYIKNITQHINLQELNRGKRITYSERVTLPLKGEASIEKNSDEGKNSTGKVTGKNHLYELFKTGKKVVAVELDPPFDAKDEKILECAEKLKNSSVDAITLADSPMGRSRVDSILMSVKIAGKTGMEVMPHLCCRDKNMIAMRSGILGAYVNGIRNILVVTGDPIPSENRQSTTGVFDYNSVQLMEFVNEMNREHFSDNPIYYGGALNYARGDIPKIVERMQKKIDAGVKYFLTQPVFSEEDIHRIKCIKEMIDTRILCGIMPLVSYRNANFIKNEITGIHVPDEIVNRYRSDMSKEEAEWTGAEIANEIIEKLSPFVDGYYFMLPFNRVSLMDKIRII